MKGLIISPPMGGSDNGAFQYCPWFDEQLVRSWLLFWERLEWPETNIKIEIPGFSLEIPLADALLSLGALQRTNIEVEKSLNNAEIFIYPHLKAYEKLELENPGTWSLATGPNAFSVPDMRYSNSPGIELRLISALPVPNRSVPLEDVLEFRRRRKPELDSLLSAVDEISERFLDDPKRPLEENAAVRRFANNCRDYLTTCGEKSFPVRMLDLSARYTGAAMLGASPSIAFGASLSEIVGNGLLASGMLAIGDRLSFSSRPKSNHPYAYVFDYHSELFSLREGQFEPFELDEPEVDRIPVLRGFPKDDVAAIFKEP